MKQKIRFALCFAIVAASLQAGVKSETGPVTQISTSLCGTTLPQIDTSITAGIVAGASAYRFRVATTLTGGTVLTQTFTSVLRVFKLTQLDTYFFNAAYTIDVAVKVNNVWQAYGPVCTLNSPAPVTNIQSSQCGLAVDALNTPIYAGLVPFAPGYRFRLTNMSAPAQQFTVDRPLRDFAFSFIPAQAGTTYLVEVAVKNFDGSYLPYGPGCPVTSPSMTTKIGAQYCGRTINTFGDYIYADLIPGALMYRFKVTNLSSGTIEILDRPLRSFCLTMLSDVSYNTGYNVEVAVKDPAGNFQPFGPFCTIFTPIIATPKIQLSQCEMVASGMADQIFADDFPNATAYKFKLYNTEIGYSQTVIRSSRYFSLSMFSGIQAGATYTIRVAAKVNGYFTAYGKPCAVTAPSAIVARVSDNDKSSEQTMPTLYPNPFSESFSIAAHAGGAEVSVAVYDMMGRLLEKQNLPTAQLPGLALGKTYPAGVYNVILTTEEQTRLMRVVKR